MTRDRRQKIDEWLGKTSRHGYAGPSARLLFGLGLARALGSQDLPRVLYEDLLAAVGIVCDAGAELDLPGQDSVGQLASQIVAEDIIEELYRASVLYGATEPGRKRSGSYYTPAALARELARLSDGDEPRREGLGDGGAEDEAAALGPHNQLDALAAVRIGHEFNG